MQLARKKNSIAHAAFETLETRQLMSVTVAPSGGNDTAAIQNAINSAPAGSTVNLGAGTYHVNSMLNINGHILAGVSGQTTIQWTGGSSSFAVNTGSNSELTGVTVTGAGVQITDSSSNVIITNDTIENTAGTGISAQGGCNNLQVTHNKVQNIGGYGMVLYSINDANVDYNTITNIYEGIHAVNFLGTNAGNNCTINYNTVTGITRHGIEVQNNWDNLSIGWNYVADFNVQPSGNSHMALSIATGPGAGGALAENVDVHDNVLLGTGPGIPNNPNYCFTAIEIMGNGSIVNHNYMANWGWGVLDGFTSNWQVTNNDYVGVTSMNGQDALAESNGTAPAVDSGNVHIASWDGTVPSAFDDAGVNGGGAVSATAVATPTNLTATSPNSSQINLNWQDNTSGTATYTIQIKSTYGSDPYVTAANLPAGTTSYNITGLNPNWVYSITVTATVSGQNSTSAFVQDQVQPPAAVSTAPITVSSGAGSTSGSSSSSSSTKTSSTGGSKSTGSSSGTKAKTTSTSASSGTSGSSSSGATVSSSSETTTKAEKRAEKVAEKVEAKAEKKADKADKQAAKKAAKGVSSAPPAVAAASGHGLEATFYKGRNMKAKNAVASEVTGNVDYTFSGKSDTVPALTSPAGKSNYSVVWTGEVEAPTSGKYQLTTKADDGIRVWIDGKEVIDDWQVQETTTDTGTIKLVAGQKYDIKVEYFQKNGKANAQLTWATKGTAKEAIPDEDLYLPVAA